MLPSLKFAKQPYPHTQIGICVNKVPLDRNNLKRFAQHHGFIVTEIDKSVILSEQPVKNAGGGYNFIFTGIAFDNGKLIFGMNDCQNVDNMDEGFGEFAFIKITRDFNIELSVDYFGFTKWYYYDDDTIFVASINYHMLLLMLSAIGVKLRMDIKRSRVNLYTKGSAFGQIFSRKMDVVNTYVSLPTERIVISNGKLTLGKTSLLELLTCNEEFDEDVYEDYLFKAKDEIYNNLRAVLEYEKFEKVVVDISGGFDSRIVYATMTTMPKRLRKKVVVFCRPSHLNDDMEKASGMNNVYNYKMFNIYDSDTGEIFDGDLLNHYNVSVELGRYTYMPLDKKCNANPKIIELMGGNGDFVFGYKRVYCDYQELFLNNPPDDDIVLGKIAKYSSVSFDDSCKDVIDDAKYYLSSELEEYKDVHLGRRMHIFYALFRNGCHFPAFRYRHRLLTLSVLFTKYALKAKMMYWQKFSRNDIPDEKISVDLLNMINPLLGQIPFAAENDDVMPDNDDLLNPAFLKIEPDFSVKPYVFFNTKIVGKTYTQKIWEYTNNLNIFYEMLNAIGEYSAEYQPVISAMLKTLKNVESTPLETLQAKSLGTIQTIYKIFHVYYEMCIVNGKGDLYPSVTNSENSNMLISNIENSSKRISLRRIIKWLLPYGKE